MLEVLFVLLMLSGGMWLSAFFSGSETGFYRLSLPRLGIDSRAGDRVAQRLMHFARNPANFVATCLIGNNVANYLTTAAISWSVVLFLGHSSDAGEILSTLLFAPILFLAGEMVPKSLYYQTPYGRLRKNIPLFQIIYWSFLPLTWPLVQLTRWLETLTGQSHQPVELVLGRSRFVQLVQHGRQEGVLKDVQSRLANGLLQLAPQPVAQSIIPNARVFGVSDQVSRTEALKVARNYGVPLLPVRQETPDSWYGVVAVRELLAADGKWQARPLPQIEASVSKLEALNVLRTHHAPYAVVVNEGTVQGLVSRHGLVEQLFRPDPGHR